MSRLGFQLPTEHPNHQAVKLNDRIFKPAFDLPTFVDEVIRAKHGQLTLDETVVEIDHEIANVERNLSRDAHTRFQQMRYLNSLSRLVQFLRTHALPTDLTPRERIAIRSLSDFIGNPPQGLASSFNRVTLPKGVFGDSFEMTHRLAS